jgi:hypothetical protein
MIGEVKNIISLLFGSLINIPSDFINNLINQETKMENKEIEFNYNSIK